MSMKVQDAVQKIMVPLMRACEADKMTAVEAVEYLGEIEEACRSAAEAVKEENGLDE